MMPIDQHIHDSGNTDLYSLQQENNPVASQVIQSPASKQTVEVLQQPTGINGPRKSIGRRVSFATTARVRLYEKDEDELSSNDSSDSDIPSTFEPNESTQKRIPSLWKPMPLAMKISEEDEDINTMAITTCVGGILDDISSNTNIDTHDMELTTCVGGLLSQSISESINFESLADMDITECVGNVIVESYHPDNSMEMTTCIGGILESRSIQDHVELSTNTINTAVDNDNDSNQHSIHEDNASFEVFVDDKVSFALSPQKDNIEQFPRVSTPIALQTKKSPLWRVSLSPIHLFSKDHKLLSNRDSLNPGTPKWAPYTTPIHASIAQLSGGTKRSSLIKHRTSDTLKDDVSFINTIEKPQIFDMMDSPLSNRHSNDHHSPLVLTPKQSINHVSITPSKLSLKTNKEETSALFSPRNLKKKQTILNPAHPIPTMKEFLSTIGIRFLDHVSSSARRETLARLHDERSCDGGYFRDKLLISMCIHQPENQLYEQGCAVLEEKISEAKSVLDGLESKFVNQPPPCLVNNQDFYSNEWLQRFKLIKSHARNQVKDQWYNWRKSHLGPLVGLYNDHIQRLQADGNILFMIRGQVETITNQISTIKQWLIERHNSLKKEKHILNNTDWKLYHALIDQKGQNDLHITQLQSNIDHLQMKQSREWEQMEELCRNRDGVMDQLGQAHNDIGSIVDIDALELEWNRMSYDLLCKTSGVYPKKLSKDRMEFTCQPFRDLKLYLIVSRSIPSIQMLSNDVSHIIDSFCCRILPKILENVPLKNLFTVLYEEIFLVKELDDEIVMASLNYHFEIVQSDECNISSLILCLERISDITINILHSSNASTLEYQVIYTMNNETVTSRYTNITLNKLLEQLSTLDK